MVESEALPGLVQIGETLRAAREGRGIPLETAAVQLRCDLRVIEALESGRFDELGPPVFARGHLLRYAALLGEPGEAMVEEWSQIAAGGAGAELMRGLHGPRGRDLRAVRKRLVTAAALLSLVAIAVWGLQNLPGRSTSTAKPAVAAAPAADASAAEDAASAAQPKPVPGNDALVSTSPSMVAGATGSTPPASTPPVSPPADSPARIESAPAAVGARDAPPASAALPRGLVQLRLAFAEESWLEIYDVNNRRLFFGLATVGAPVAVQGRAPLRMIVGNAPAVMIELNGRRVEVPPDAMRSRRAAALRVNADGGLLALPRA